MATSRRSGERIEQVKGFLRNLHELEKRFQIFIGDGELIDGNGQFEGFLERSRGDLQVVVDGEVLLEVLKSG